MQIGFIDSEFVRLQQRAIAVANNDALLHWAQQSPLLSCEEYSLLVANLRQWLTPTARRLELGLKLIQKNKDERFNPIESAFVHNIEDERGEHDPQNAHAKLFIDSAVQFGLALYGEAPKPSQILPATRNLHNSSIELFNSNIYIMLGACMAQEIHALPQLVHLYSGCQVQRSKFSDEQWTTVSHFYQIHLDGTEARHADDLVRTVWSVLDTEHKRNLFYQGFSEFLDLLESFWDNIANELSLS